MTIKRALRTALFLAATITGSLPAMAGDVYVVSLTFVNKWDKYIELHFFPGGGGSKADCKAALPQAIAAFKDDLYKSFKANYGIDNTSWKKVKFVEGKCTNDDSAYFQLMNLKLSPK